MVTLGVTNPPMSQTTSQSLRLQKTLPDFLLTEKMLGITTVDVAEIQKSGNRLFYQRNGRQIPVRRIYNRVIVDEVIRRNIQTSFRFTDDLDVEWAGHPNWFFRMSKYSLPFLHPTEVGHSGRRFGSCICGTIDVYRCSQLSAWAAAR